MKEIQFGLIGTGMIAEFHAQAIAAVPGARLSGVYSRSSEKATAFAEKHGAQAFTSLEALLAQPGLDAVCIATPSGHHAEGAIAALNAGKHVFCEKPLEVTLEKVDAIIDAAARNGRNLAAVFQMRFGAAAGKLKKAIEAGRFGKMTMCSCYIKWYRSQEYYDQGAWRGTKELDGGGVLFNQGIHGLDLLQWLVGMPSEVQARVDTLAHERIEVEDTAVALLRYPSGALGVIEASTATWPGFSTRIEISGDRGSATLENDRITFWKFADEEEGDAEIIAQTSTAALGSGASDPKAINIEGHRRQIEDLASAIREGRAPAIRGEDARNAVQLILAIYEAAEKGTSVRLG